MNEPLHPDELDETIHQKVRLVIVSALAAQDELTFGELKELTGATDGNLSVHLRVLEDAGFVSIRKRFVGRKPRTSYRLKDDGRDAFKNYLARLARLVKESEARDSQGEGSR
jgi:DNA-binding transcriptional ArsR family regulator